MARESMRSKRLRASVPFAKTGVFSAPVATATDKAEAKARVAASRKLAAAEASAGTVKLSTGVPLLPADALTAPVRHGAGSAVALSEGMQEQHATIREYMARQGFAEATAVQLQCWPAAVAGADVVAQVRSVPTAAFAHAALCVPWVPGSVCTCVASPCALFAVYSLGRARHAALLDVPRRLPAAPPTPRRSRR